MTGASAPQGSDFVRCATIVVVVLSICPSGEDAGLEVGAALPSEVESGTRFRTDSAIAGPVLDVGALERSATHSRSIVVPQPGSVIADVDIVAVGPPSSFKVEVTCKFSEDWARILEAEVDVSELDSTCSGSSWSLSC